MMKKVSKRGRRYKNFFVSAFTEGLKKHNSQRRIIAGRVMVISLVFIARKAARRELR
jgi:hypothetical protein